MKSGHKHRFKRYKKFGIINLLKCSCGGTRTTLDASPAKVSFVIKELGLT